MGKEYQDFYKSNIEFLEGIIAWGTRKYPGQHKTDNKRLIWRQLGLGESTPSDGGWLVGKDYSAEILTAIFGASQLKKFCAYHQIRGGGANGTKLPLLDIASCVDGSRACLAYWKCEAAEKVKSQPKFKCMELDLEKLIALIPLTDELRDDIPLLESFLRDIGGSEIGFKLDEGIIRGMGAGMPLGIIHCGCAICQAKSGEQAADSIVLANLTDMHSRLWIPGRSSPSTKWLINGNADSQIFNLANLSNIVMMPGASGYPNHPSILGHQVLWCESCSPLGDVGDVILADLSQYQIIDKGSPAASYSIHLDMIDSVTHGFVTDETAMRLVYRVDGSCRPIGPITPAQTGVTTSPFVVLAERT